MAKRALVTGVTGQDGSYLAELLLTKGYEVYGLVRRLSVPNLGNIAPIAQDIHLVDGDLMDQSSLHAAVKEAQPDEVYNLAAQSFVGTSFVQPALTGEITGLGALRLLEAVRAHAPQARYYQASSSEMFGKVDREPQDETTPMHPRSPYGVAKVYAYWACINYREAYDMYVSNGILFNHESSRRGIDFLTRKVAHGVARIAAGKARAISLGSLDAKRDWGYAPEYCLSEDTEILTSHGFRKWNEIRKGESIINYNLKTNRLEQDTCLKVHLLQFAGRAVHMLGPGVDLLVTPEHRIFYQFKSGRSKGGWSDWKLSSAKDVLDRLSSSVRTNYDYRLPPLSGYDAPDIPTKDEWFALLGYLAAEGSLRKPPPGRGIGISLSQSERHNPGYHREIQATCERLGLGYRASRKEYGMTEFSFDADSTRRIVQKLDGFDVHRVPEWTLGGSRRQLGRLFTTMMNGDGHWGSMTYTSRRWSLVSDFQTIATILGYRTRVHHWQSGMYACTVVSPRKPHPYILEGRREPYSGLVWCLTTHNSTLVVRRNGCVSVVGNCDLMWRILQHERPDDFVGATGEAHSVREFVEEAFHVAGMPDWEKYVTVDERNLRPSEVYNLRGDASKAKRLLGWEPKVRFKELVRIMVEAELQALGRKNA